MKKQFILMFLVLCTVISLFPNAVTAANDTLLAVPSKTSFVMNDKPVSVTQAYSINGANYLQLRAIAELLNGTASQFNVGWDGKYAVIETGKPYSGTATPTALKNTENVRKSNTSFKLDGAVITFENTYLIDGNTNYLQLREFAQKLSGTASQFNVYWDNAASQAVIVPGTKYTGEEPDPLSEDFWSELFSDFETSLNDLEKSLDDLFNELNTDISFDFDIELESTPKNESTTTATPKKTETAKQTEIPKQTETTKPAETAKQTETPKQTENSKQTEMPEQTKTTITTEPTLLNKVYTASDSSVTSIDRAFELFDDEGNCITWYDAAGNSINLYASGAELVITKNIKTIEDYAFYHNDLGKFTVEKNNPNFTTVDGVLFNKDKTILIAYPTAKPDKTYKVPDSVTEIATGAFAYSTYLEEIEFGSNLKTIGVDAFRACRFSEVVIPEGVTAIYGCAFTDMKKLEKITIPRSVKVIVTDVFSGSNPDVVICGLKGSLAEYYASQYGYKFVAADSFAGKDPSGLTTIKLGQTELEAGISKDYLVSIKTRNGEWGIYGSKDYENFLAVYYENYKAKFIYTTDLSTYTGDGTVYTDKNDNNKEYAVSVGILPSFDAATNETLIFELTNAFRAVHGLSPLQWNDKLQAAARSHSEDMEARNFFSHTNPDGSEPWDRITAAGYKWRACAENIYMNSAGADAISAMDGWINSPGHRQNLLTTDCDELGVGISGAYATQNFGRK